MQASATNEHVPTREEILAEITIDNLRTAVEDDDCTALALIAEVIEQARYHLAATQRPFEPIKNGGLQLPMAFGHLTAEAREFRRVEADRRLYQAVLGLEAHLHG